MISAHVYGPSVERGMSCGYGMLSVRVLRDRFLSLPATSFARVESSRKIGRGVVRSSVSTVGGVVVVVGDHIVERGCVDVGRSVC